MELRPSFAKVLTRKSVFGKKQPLDRLTFLRFHGASLSPQVARI